MNRFNKLGGIVFALALMLFFFSCEENEFDTPPEQTLDENAILSISNLRDLCPTGRTYTFTGDSSVFAVVTMDESTGNIYKQLYVQDAEQAVELRLSASSRIQQGDSLRVNLKGSILRYFNNQFQVDNLNVQNLVVQESGLDKDPIIVTISELLASNFSAAYHTKLIKIDNVQFIDDELDETFADAINQEAVDRKIEDMAGKIIKVRTSGYASFAGTNVPEGSGSIIAIATQYGTDWQLVVRKLSEVQMDGERF